MSNLDKHLSDILEDYLNGDTEESAIQQIKALLPSLEGWVKVRKCPNLGSSIPNGQCTICDDTGKICTPLEFGDMDWNRVLKYLDDTGYLNLASVTTKSGAVIRRREK